MPFRVSFFFELRQSKIGGWSENFWNSGSDKSVVAATARIFGRLLLNLKGGGTIWAATRVSDVANFRNSDLDEVPVQTDAPTNVDSGDWSDFVSQAGLLRLTATTGNATSQWMKGLMDGDVRGGARWLPRSVSLTRVNAIFAHLTTSSNGWALRVLDPTNQKKPIINATNAGVITCTGHGLASGNVTRISRIQGNGNWNGVWTVNVIDANSFSLVAYVPPSGVTVVYVGKGTSRKQATIYPAINAAKIQRITKHNTGRPFGQLTGRRKPRTHS